eukprot:TRINITY_DN76347_c0_g1_i1.p1 TRINITY_DN76347_c0_g1~~TRINITY_DN76347_c0_g1_i1.p1  ORF type:complete len:494 (-),score=21.62 TRINITY_DN76347_c0_g1_i1:26-1471(-)
MRGLDSLVLVHPQNFPWFHYGWWVLIGGNTLEICAAPGQASVMGVFINAFVNNGLITRSFLSTIYSIVTVSCGFLMLPLSSRLQKGQFQSTGITCLLLLFLTCMLISSVPLNMTTIFGCLFGLRLFGFSSSSLLRRVILQIWWVRRAGRATILYAFTRLAVAGIMPTIAQALCSHLGWQNAYRALACFALLFGIPAVLLCFYAPPEQFGMLPDAEYKNNENKIDDDPTSITSSVSDLEQPNNTTPPAVAGGGSPTTTTTSAPVSPNSGGSGSGSATQTKIDDLEGHSADEVVKTQVFWLMFFSKLLMAGMTAGFHTQFPGYIQRMGARSILLPLFITNGICITTSTITFATLADTVSLNRNPLLLVSCGLVLNATYVGFAAFGSGNACAIGLAIAFGIGEGCMVAVNNIVAVKLWGRKGIAKLTAFANIADTIACGVGPLLLGIALEIPTQTSQIGFMVLIPILLACACWGLLLTPPSSPR